MTDQANASGNQSAKHDAEIPQGFRVATHLLSILLLSLAYVAIVDEGPGTILVAGLYLLGLYAIAGGFNWRLEKLSTTRGLVFFVLSGLVGGLFFYGVWYVIRWLLAKIFGLHMSSVKGKLLSRKTKQL